MAYRCETCGKTTVVGRSKQHRRGVAGKRWKDRAQPTKRLFRPNIQKITVTKDGEKKQIKLCAKCIKRRKRDASLSYTQL